MDSAWPRTPAGNNRFTFANLDDNTALNLSNTAMGLSHNLTLKQDTQPELEGIRDGESYAGALGSSKKFNITLTDPDPSQEFILTLTKGSETIFSGAVKNGETLEQELPYAAGATSCSLTMETRCNGILLNSEAISFSMQGYDPGASANRIVNVSGSGSVSTEDTLFFILNEDAASEEGIGFSFEFDGTKWDFVDTAPPMGIITSEDLPQAYGHAKIVSGNADGIELNLDGDSEKTVDLSISFGVPVQEGGMLGFDIVLPE